tara:strand:+ start:1196 stop:1537 length:342 start_codon:yes stop_codon:yes gene_type:complete
VWLHVERLSPELIAARWRILGVAGVCQETLYTWIWDAKKSKHRNLIKDNMLYLTLCMVDGAESAATITAPEEQSKILYLYVKDQSALISENVYEISSTSNDGSKPQVGITRYD